MYNWMEGQNLQPNQVQDKLTIQHENGHEEEEEEEVVDIAKKVTVPKRHFGRIVNPTARVTLKEEEGVEVVLPDDLMKDEVGEANQKFLGHRGHFRRECFHRKKENENEKTAKAAVASSWTLL